jgi:ribosomal protein S18 acetylase RimI-like enzyme
MQLSCSCTQDLWNSFHNCHRTRITAITHLSLIYLSLSSLTNGFFLFILLSVLFSLFFGFFCVSELGQVADLIMDSFYTTTTTETGGGGGFIWKRLYKLAELNRLQQNFAYPDQADQHQMLVVELQADNNNNNNNGHRSNAIVGFCDVDDRPLPLDFKVQLPPRPYLSDLCIAVDHRRQGLASALVEHAERFCIETTLEDDNDSDSDSDNDVVLWIRVQEANTAALAMYQRLGYQIVSKDLDTTTTTFQKAAENKEMIYTLRKYLKK